jgi:hypothetical protein
MVKGMETFEDVKYLIDKRFTDLISDNQFTKNTDKELEHVLLRFINMIDFLPTEHDKAVKYALDLFINKEKDDG